MRDYNYEIMDYIQKRWSPRAFSPETIPHEDVRGILEAARYAPSCFNEQPWLFMVAEGDDLETFRDLLLPKNLMWAGKAPVLILVLYKETFEHNGKINKYAAFDSGTAWGFLSLEAVRRGYQTHAMAGFRKSTAREVLNIPEAYVPHAMIALGLPGDLKDLDESFHEKEQPNTRKPLDEVMVSINHFKE